MKFYILEERMRSKQLSYEMDNFQLNCSLSAHSAAYAPRHPTVVSVKLSRTSEGTEFYI